MTVLMIVSAVVVFLVICLLAFGLSAEKARSANAERLAEDFRARAIDYREKLEALRKYTPAFQTLKSQVKDLESQVEDLQHLVEQKEFEFEQLKSATKKERVSKADIKSAIYNLNQLVK